jgi:hypothetical protein
VVGARRSRSSRLQKKPVQHGLGLLVPHSRVQQVFTPVGGDPPSIASFAPCRRSDSYTASANRYSTSMPARSRVIDLVVNP